MDIFDYYHSIPKGQRSLLKNKAIKALGISEPSFYLKLRTGKWKLLEKKAMESLINEHREIIKNWGDANED